MSDELTVNFIWSESDVMRLAKSMNIIFDRDDVKLTMRVAETNFDQATGVCNNFFLKIIQDIALSKKQLNTKLQLEDVETFFKGKYKKSVNGARLKEFIGICKGIILDDVVNDVEVQNLGDWLLSNNDLRKADEVEVIYKIYEEGRSLSTGQIAEKLKDYLHSLYKKEDFSVLELAEEDIDFGLGI